MTKKRSKTTVMSDKSEHTLFHLNVWSSGGLSCLSLWSHYLSMISKFVFFTFNLRGINSWVFMLPYCGGFMSQENTILFCTELIKILLTEL